MGLRDAGGITGIQSNRMTCVAMAVTTRLKAARLRHYACLEDIDYRSPRGLDKYLILHWAAANGCATV